MDSNNSSTDGAPDEGQKEEILGLNKVVVLKHDRKGGNPCTFYIVGTAHIARDSCDKVEAVIQSIRPDTVFLELCDARKSMLRDMKDMTIPSFNEILKNISEGKTTLFEALYSWMLAKFGSEMEVFPGEEFRVAFMEAQKLRARVVLGDRPVHTTIARMWSSLTCWQKAKLCWHLVVTGINPNMEEMNKLFDEWAESDAMTDAIKELSRTFPSLAKHLIAERDLYMVHAMHELAKSSNVVVSVVGAGHLPGITENWNKEIDIDEISRMPPKKPPTPLWQYGIWVTGSVAVVSVIVMKLRSRR